MTNQLKKYRDDLKCVAGIKVRSEHMKENIKLIAEEKQLAADQIGKKKSKARGCER
ncbi:hypothetical protein [Caproiciproducens sp. CPB-2]|uniref:hypothetical protein n=1 Tax=Caproiciproducens sp. CPB-2 TaxID=3030017 RepID=UPI0023DCC851|nr:hypothetical protein [Caproiciproducens sp. CPB-2]MDF1494982.1 hypothetical protein [Caproiciproducens sp. CPB-2]